MARRYLTSLLILCLFALVGICPAPLSAQNALIAPPGSYAQSCQHVEMHGTTMTALCKNDSGNLIPARLENAASCIADLANSNGVLQCKGAYTQTCQGLGWRGAALFGQCTGFFGGLQATELGYAKSCLEEKHVIANINGSLRCVVWWAKIRAMFPYKITKRTIAPRLRSG